MKNTAMTLLGAVSLLLPAIVSAQLKPQWVQKGAAALPDGVGAGVTLRF